MLPSTVTSIRSLSVALALTLSVAAHAQSNPPAIQVVTLCAPGEQVLMAGRMQQVKRGGTSTTYVPNGKYASLCANSADEPITSMVYRYGKPGAIEMEEKATSQRKFFVYFESGGPRSGSNTVWFTKGEYRYQIEAGVGMARGVSVSVYKGGKQVVDLFSDLGDEDHYSNTLGIDFSAPKSPVLTARSPL